MYVYIYIYIYVYMLLYYIMFYYIMVYYVILYYIQFITSAPSYISTGYSYFSFSKHAVSSFGAARVWAFDDRA